MRRTTPLFYISLSLKCCILFYAMRCDWMGWDGMWNRCLCASFALWWIKSWLHIYLAITTKPKPSAANIHSQWYRDTRHRHTRFQIKCEAVLGSFAGRSHTQINFYQCDYLWSSFVFHSSPLFLLLFLFLFHCVSIALFVSVLLPIKCSTS